MVACASTFATGIKGARAQTYSVTDLGMLSPAAINIEGKVAGNYQNQAYIWTKRDGLQALGTLPGGTTSTAAAINDLGDVAGTADGIGTVFSPYVEFQNLYCTDLTQPFIWTHAGGMEGLGTIGFYNGIFEEGCSIPFYATGINDQGEEVGYSSADATYETGFTWTNAADMNTFAIGYPSTFINGITDSGEIVGQYGSGAGDENYIGVATTWNGGQGDLGTLGGADVENWASSANAVNLLGQVVGWSTTGTTQFGGSNVHAVLWTRSGGISDLGALAGDTSSAALKINFFGLIIGTSGSGIYDGVDEPPPFQVTGRPFLWSKATGMLDLNTLISSNSGWDLTSVADINLWGQIIGSGMLNGQPHGFLLTPRYR